MLPIVRFLVAALMALGGLAEPVPGDIAIRFDPPHHYGIDVALANLSMVSAVMPGDVSFAGEVADMMSVTVDHGGGVKTSYSFLDSVSVSYGQTVLAGTPVGIASGHNGIFGFHLSLRINGHYVDPSVLFAAVVPGTGLRLISPPLASSHNLT